MTCLEIQHAETVWDTRSKRSEFNNDIVFFEKTIHQHLGKGYLLAH
jgi:hypothetical protein